MIELLLSTLAITSALAQTNPSYQLLGYCDRLYSLACFKLDASRWLDNLDNNEFNVIPGVTFMPSPNVKVYTHNIAEEVAREFPHDEEARVNQFVLRKLEQFLKNHSVKLNLYSAIADESRKDKGSKKGGTGMIVIAGGLLMGLMTALAMGGLTALAGKALLTGVVSFVLSTIIGLKQLTSNKTIVAQPVYSHAEGWEEYGVHKRSSNDVTKRLKR